MRIISFPQESPIYRNIFHSFEHSAHIIYTRCASCSVCSISRSCSSADHVTDTVADSIHVLLRSDHVYVGIEAAPSTYGLVGCGSFRTGWYHPPVIDPVHRVRVSCLSNSCDLAILD